MAAMAFVRWVLGVSGMMVTFVAGGMAVVLLLAGDVFGALIAAGVCWLGYKLMVGVYREG